jgi:hypothetical protein
MLLTIKMQNRICWEGDRFISVNETLRINGNQSAITLEPVDTHLMEPTVLQVLHLFIIWI